MPEGRSHTDHGPGEAMVQRGQVVCRHVAVFVLPTGLAWGGGPDTWQSPKGVPGASLVVQWLRHHASSAGGTSSIPGQGTKIPPGTKSERKKKIKCSKSERVNE